MLITLQTVCTKIRLDKTWGPNLDQNCQTLTVVLKIFLENFPACKDLTGTLVSGLQFQDNYPQLQQIDADMQYILIDTECSADLHNLSKLIDFRSLRSSLVS